MSRKYARDLAFKVIYQFEIQKDNVEEIISLTMEEEKDAKGDEIKYINTVSLGVIEHNEELTNIIQTNLRKGWDIKRISKLNIAILKVAIFELKYLTNEIPPKVAISEALDFIDLYGEEKEKAFINGVLANVYKEIIKEV